MQLHWTNRSVAGVFATGHTVDGQVDFENSNAQTLGSEAADPAKGCGGEYRFGVCRSVTASYRSGRNAVCKRSEVQ